MRLIKPTVELIEQEPGIEGLFKHMELCARTCYKSEDKIAEDSAERFVHMLINRGHCYDGDTEILTNEGFVKFKDYKGQDVAVVNYDSTFLRFETPRDVIHQKFTGKMYNYNNLGISVTDGHNMFMHVFNKAADRGSEFKGELHACNEPFKDTTYGQRPFKVATTTKKLDIIDKSEEYYLGALLGFWVGDGESFYSTNYLGFHLLKGRKVDFLKEVCLNLNLELTECANNKYTVFKEGIGDEFRRLFIYNGEKYLPLDYLTSGIEYLSGIYEGLINSDGSIEKTGTSYSSKSEHILNWILNTAPIVGYTASKGAYDTTTGVGKVFLLKRNTKLVNDSRTQSSKVYITEETDIPVYCVTVSTGIIIVRGSNGVVSLCGNCAMLEHGTVYLRYDFKANDESNTIAYRLWSKYNENQYSEAVQAQPISGIPNGFAAITTNYRVLLQNNWLDDLQYLCEPTQYHVRRVTVKFTIDRGVSHEFVRHRKFSFAQESTRYCNYSRDKFSNEIVFILPPWVDEMQLGRHNSQELLIQMGNLNNPVYSQEDLNELYFLFGLASSEIQYFNLIKGGWIAQQARVVLPSSLKTELIMTGTIKQWIEFFKLRCARDAHPQAKEVADQLRSLMLIKGYITQDEEGNLQVPNRY